MRAGRKSAWGLWLIAWIASIASIASIAAAGCGSTTVERPEADGSPTEDTTQADSSGPVDPCATVTCVLGKVCQGGQCVLGTDDFDQDGFPAADDCNDFSALVNPLAPEVCDGLDNNCDGTVDEGFDGDHDGYNACPGANPDCDDTDGAVHPNATEVCDGVDNNCDGRTDEGFDGDGDGYSACSAQLDCDDTDPAIHPGATEVCDNDDNDCDGANNEGDVCVGCSDGARDALADQVHWPAVAACAGTFARQSLRSPRTNTPCGDDLGTTCNAPEDLCAAGWHLCMRNGDPYDLRLRLTAAECKTVSGSYVAATDHCTGPTDVMPDDCTSILLPPYGCRDSGFCAGPVVCGGAEHTRCMHAVWPLADGGTFTFSSHAGRADAGGGCGDFSPSTTYTSDLTGGTISFSGVLCCRD